MDWLRFVQLDPFAKQWARLDLTDDDLRALEVCIMTRGDRSPVIKGTGGLRKLRMAPIESNRGKRDAFRVCYVLFPAFGIVLLVTVYGKNEKADLSDADRSAIAAIIRQIQGQLDRGLIR